MVTVTPPRGAVTESADDELLDEVELTANLIVAANQSDTPMSLAEIDRILGIEPRRAQG